MRDCHYVFYIILSRWWESCSLRFWDAGQEGLSAVIQTDSTPYLIYYDTGQMYKVEYLMWMRFVVPYLRAWDIPAVDQMISITVIMTISVELWRLSSMPVKSILPVFLIASLRGTKKPCYAVRR